MVLSVRSAASVLFFGSSRWQWHEKVWPHCVTRTMMRRAGARTGACMNFDVTAVRSGYTRGYIRDVPLRGFCAALPSYTGRDDDIWFGR